MQNQSPAEIRDVLSSLEMLCNKNTLKVLFVLYELTVKDFNVFVSLNTISEKCKLSLEDAQAALNDLPIQMEDSDDGIVLYRIEGCYMHIPALLLMFRKK